VAERLYQSMLTLPLHVELQEEDQDLIAGIVRRCLK
jgi:dTDP-4-amino-4,6-dideoxygalactose transaminase